ncbi:MAG TPA: carbamoyltransferase HypF [Thermoleophilia bacterium]|nr:carbamoyltransferase HypF [Thermoleophilia bacterium]
MDARNAPQGERSALHLSVSGVVQGVGFRPYVFGLARRHGIFGWARNTSAGVEIHAEGSPADVERFAAALPCEAPPRSHITSCSAAAALPEGSAAFAILESAAEPGAYQLVSPDLATCAVCRAELLDPRDRRYEYPFTNCTDCGPRFTIIEDLPYDRERTTMRRFPLCPACRVEYEDPADRRFHAEPNACPVCGPKVRLLRREAGRGGRGSGVEGDMVVLAEGTAEDPAGPIRDAAELLRDGEIVAVKGLGGFHLACDATDEDVVRRLKTRKRRPHKPLAVMFSDLDDLREHCRVNAAEEALLTSPALPIVLLEWCEEAPERPVTPEVAPGQRYLGAMLPYTPVHILLLRAARRPLVMTSGNLADEPIVKDWAEIARLAPVADAYLVHDRGIAARCDDSVAVVQSDQTRLVRRARGYAPLPLQLPRAIPQTLACGAELKSAFCLTRDANAFLSQHIGDLENLETLEAFEAGIVWYERLFRASPEVIGYDLHPEYMATKFAQTLPQKEKVAVQHHHAHVAARLVEHGSEAPVIGVSMDGLGYGDDGRLWGGEILVCDLLGYRRVAHLEELPLPGGAAAIGRPWRTAAGWAYSLLGEEGLARAASLIRRRAAAGELLPSDEELTTIRQQIDRSLNAPLTTSCGRLFDAVSALAGVRLAVTYEGQAAIELETLSAPAASNPRPYPFTIDGDVAAAAVGPRMGAEEWVAVRAEGAVLGPRSAVVGLAPVLGAVIDDLEAGAAAGAVGARLHATIAALVLESCRRVRSATGLASVALVGGVFQNRLLSGQCEAGLRVAGFEVLSGGLVPGNDGGVALGQAAIAGYTVLQRRGTLDDPPYRQD